MNIRPEPTHHTESYTNRNTYKQTIMKTKKIVTNTTMSTIMMKIKNIPKLCQK